MKEQLRQALIPIFIQTSTLASPPPLNEPQQQQILHLHGAIEDITNIVSKLLNTLPVPFYKTTTLDPLKWEHYNNETICWIQNPIADHHLHPLLSGCTPSTLIIIVSDATDKQMAKGERNTVKYNETLTRLDATAGSHHIDADTAHSAQFELWLAKIIQRACGANPHRI
jgi:hypothetical protein